MGRRFRPPLIVFAGGLLALIAALAFVQYRWVGQISDAERDRMRATVRSRAAALARDFDRELTLAYMLFQLESPRGRPDPGPAELTPLLAARHDRWNAAARYPQLIAESFVVVPAAAAEPSLHRYDRATRTLSAHPWPASLDAVRAGLRAAPVEREPDVILRRLLPALWPDMPALVVPSAPSAVILTERDAAGAPGLPSAGPLFFTVLLLDRAFITSHVLPQLAAVHFPAEGTQYQVAVLASAGSRVIFRSSTAVTPPAEGAGDAVADMFNVRPQDYPELVDDVRRFAALALPLSMSDPPALTAFSMSIGAAGDPAAPPAGTPAGGSARVLIRERRLPGRTGEPVRDRTFVHALSAASGTGAWRLIVTHPAGSLEAAVERVRRRNLVISSSILGVLAASLALLLVSTRRAQQLARQQMEFVAAVSHELRTPLAVVRSAGDNLADGVVHGEVHVRRYGEIVRGESRRLAEMVEQLLELAGIQSGGRAFASVPVDIAALAADVAAAGAPLAEKAGVELALDLPPGIPPVAGDEAGLRRVLQNLIDNGIKYGGTGGWVGLAARAAGGNVELTVADRGIGIAAADQVRIFDPFFRAAAVTAAQIPGAGLGLSLVRRIVEAHGGGIAVQSTPGRGTVFTLTLPASPAPPVR